MSKSAIASLAEDLSKLDKPRTDQGSTAYVVVNYETYEFIKVFASKQDAEEFAKDARQRGWSFHATEVEVE